MKKLPWILLFASLFVAIGAILYLRMPEVGDVLDREGQAIQSIAQIVIKDQEEELWKGYRLADQPLVISFDNGHTYAFCLRDDANIWEKKIFHGYEVLFSPLDRWAIEKIQFRQQVPIEGQSAVVFRWDDSDGNVTPALFSLVHRTFHQFEQSHFSSPGYDKEYVDHFNLQNIALMQLEEMLLADFMNAIFDKVKSLQHKTAHLMNFLAINRIRSQLLKPSSLQWEKQRQRIEGVADFVAYGALERLGISGQEQALARLQLSSINEEVLERAVKFRHNAVGSVLCYALEFLGVDNWKKRVEEGASPVDLLAEAFPMTDEEMVQRVAKTTNRYAFDSLLQQIKQVMSEYGDEVAELVGKYQKVEGVEVHLYYPKEVEENDMGSGSELYYMHDGSTLALSESLSWKLRGGKWRFTTLGIPLKRYLGFVAFKAELKTLCTLDGRVQPLGDLLKREGERPFSSFSLDGGAFNLQSKEMPGRLIVEHDEVSVIYDGV